MNPGEDAAAEDEEEEDELNGGAGGVNDLDAEVAGFRASDPSEDPDSTAASDAEEAEEEDEEEEEGEAEEEAEEEKEEAAGQGARVGAKRSAAAAGLSERDGNRNLKPARTAVDPGECVGWGDEGLDSGDATGEYSAPLRMRCMTTLKRYSGELSGITA